MHVQSAAQSTAPSLVYPKKRSRQSPGDLAAQGPSAPAARGVVHRPPALRRGRLAGGPRRGRVGLAIRLLEPRMGERLLHGQSLVRVDGHELLHQALCLRRHVVPHGHIELIPSPSDLLIEASVVVIEGRDTAEHDVENHTQAPHVHGFPVRCRLAPKALPVGADDLGREVAGRAAECAAVLRLRAAPREAKVRELGAALGREEDVLGFDVAVHHALRVQEGHGAAELAKEAPCLRLRQVPPADNGVQQVPTFEQFHHQEEVRRRLEPVVHADNARMREAHDGLCLAAEAQLGAMPRLEGLELGLVHGLDRTTRPGNDLYAQPDLAEVALAQGFAHVPVLTHPLLGHGALSSLLGRGPRPGHGGDGLQNGLLAEAGLVAQDTEDVGGERLLPGLAGMHAQGDLVAMLQCPRVTLPEVLLIDETAIGAQLLHKVLPAPGAVDAEVPGRHAPVLDDQLAILRVPPDHYLLPALPDLERLGLVGLDDGHQARVHQWKGREWPRQLRGNGLGLRERGRQRC
mmetsp:Transcript_100495/g.313200  ORF Transcript_100495/g.313200 Transcript_100495/m.313200 type:complete len:517 (-) Transcript_100495:142-1692(-)